MISSHFHYPLILLLFFVGPFFNSVIRYLRLFVYGTNPITMTSKEDSVLTNEDNDPVVYLKGNDSDENIEIPYRLVTLSPVLVKFIENLENENNKTIEGNDVYEVQLDNLSYNILKYVKKYLEYKYENETLMKNSNNASVADLDIPDFEYPQELSLELLMAADYLNI